MERSKSFSLSWRYKNPVTETRQQAQLSFNSLTHSLFELSKDGFFIQVESYLRIIGEPRLPSVFLQVICWVLGEYGTADRKFSASYITGKLCDVAEIDKNLSFPNGYVQQAIEKGAQPYISKNECSGMLNISNFRNQDQHEASSMHSLRIEAYELPKPLMPSMIPSVSLVSTTELVPVPEPLPSYLRETQKVASSPSVSNADPSELRLRLDGVQKKWGRRPTYSFSETSTSSPTSQKTVNGVSKVDAPGTVNSKAHDNSYNSRKPQVEISPEKQKLAASLFGGSSKTDMRGSTVGHKAGKASSHAVEKPQTTKAPVKSTAVEKIVQPPPDLLDLGEPTVVSSIPPSVDPFKQLEGLIEPTQVTSSVNHGVVDW